METKIFFKFSTENNSNIFNSNDNNIITKRFFDYFADVDW